MRNIVTKQKFTATNSNMLAGTPLEVTPNALGTLEIWCASTVDTATITISGPGVQAAVSDALEKKTDGVANLSDVLPYRVVASPGSKVIAALGGTTGTVYLVAAWTPGIL